MTSFLDRLAAMARGEAPEGAARVALPPRLLRAAPEGADGWPPVGTAPGLPAAGPAAALPRGPGPTRARPPGSGATAPGKASRMAEAEPSLAPEPQAAEHRPDGPRATDPVAIPASPETSPRVGALPTAQWPAERAGEAPATVPAAPTPVPPALLPEPERRAPPLGPAMLAARSPRTREAPVVHVTIDRIEVRAPAPIASAAPSPARCKPLPSGDSLADFLRGKRP